ncbi:MAG: hypothetical protein KDE34_00030 [Anaerolineales bacterium]|nr:hypothetical protein [Anaerolineales bacterium]
MNIEQIATATTIALVPYIPFLIQAGTAASRRLGEVIAEKGGESAWELAQGIWKVIKERFDDSVEVTKVTELVAIEPESEMYRDLLSQLLVKCMQADAGFAHALADALGGQEAAQRIIASRNSSIKNVSQQIEGSGKQTIQADDESRIEGVTQSIRRSRG